MMDDVFDLLGVSTILVFLLILVDEWKNVFLQGSEERRALC
jgi:hypothetical protein